MLDMPTPLDQARCWAAVRSRDPSADGEFYVGVVTTGIYCRPSCPSRQARPENIRFFRTAAEAEASGLRPCKRCRPNEASAVERHRRAVEAACMSIERSETTPTLSAMADAAGMSRHYFHRVFTQVMGATPGAYARTAKLRKLSTALEAGTTVTEAVYAAGFGSPSRAYEAAGSGLGMTPGAKRRGGAGERIRYTIADTAVGPMLLAASARGVCATAFDDDPAALLDELRRRFPAADLVEDRAELQDWVRAVADHLATPARALDLPLDIQGTAFQTRVWRALREIPLGQTASYAQIAAVLGRPTAVRAVARACAGNAIAVLIPCHRVVRQDGSPSGYRWGTERKRALLDAERKSASAKQPDARGRPMPGEKGPALDRAGGQAS